MMGLGSTACSIAAVWEPRAEAPEALARRFLSLTGRLKTIDPVFAQWYVWTSETTELALDQQPAALAKKIARTAELDVNGAPVSSLGYRYKVINGKTNSPPAHGFALEMRAGGSWRSPLYQNDVKLSTLTEIVPDPRVVDYLIVREAILALAEYFDPLWCSAFSSEMTNFWKKRRGPCFELAWISYIAPRMAHSIRPPQAAIVEQREDGGLLMAATAETFEVSNPVHMAVAHEIEAAVAPFREMPWPPDVEGPRP